MQVSGMLPNPFNKPGKASKPAPKAMPKAAPKQRGGTYPHRNLGAFLHPKKGK